AHAGLLDGRRATTHWAFADQLAGEFPAIDVDPDILYVDDGDVLTSAGLSAGTAAPTRRPRSHAGTSSRRTATAGRRSTSTGPSRPATTAGSPRRGHGPSSAWTRRSLSTSSPATRT